MTGEVGDRGLVLFGRQPARLKPPHLARRRGASRGALLPTIQRDHGAALGVMDILISARTRPAAACQQERVGRSRPSARRRAFRWPNPKGRVRRRFATGEQTGTDVTIEPRNCSVSRRSKSCLSVSPLGSPSAHDRSF
jgi:hypothetical protein